MAKNNYSARSGKNRIISYVLFGLSALLILLLCIAGSRSFVYGVFGYAVYAYIPMMVVSAILLIAGRAPTVKPIRAVLYVALFIMAVTTLHIGLSKELLASNNYLSASYSSKTVGGVLIGLIASLFKLICVDSYAWMLAVSFVITALLGLVALYPLIAVITDRGSRESKKKASVPTVTNKGTLEPVVPSAGSNRYGREDSGIYDLSGTKGESVDLSENPIDIKGARYKGRGASILFGDEPYTDANSERKSPSGYSVLENLGRDGVNYAITNQERARLFDENLGRKSNEEEYNERFGGGKLDGAYASTKTSYNEDGDEQYVPRTERVVPNASGLYEQSAQPYRAQPTEPTYSSPQKSDISYRDRYENAVRQSGFDAESNRGGGTASAQGYAEQKNAETASTANFTDRNSMLDYIRRPMSAEEYGSMNLVREIPSDKEDVSANVVTEAVEPDEEDDNVRAYRPTYAEPSNARENAYTSNSDYTAQAKTQKPVFTSEIMRKADEPELAKQARMNERAVNATQAQQAQTSAKEPNKEPERRYVPKPYKAPPYTLLRDYGEGCGNVPPNYEEIKYKLEETMREFDVPATVEKAVRGPSFTMYYLKLGPGYKITKIMSIKENLKMRLRVKNLRILAPIEGCDNFGVEIPNETRDKVGLRSVIDNDAFRQKSDGVQVAFGKTIDGKPYVADLAKMPHLLVAGATGTGKSVFLNSLITSILFKYSPEDVRFILIDPKRVELSVYRGLPNLLIKETIKESNHAVNVLKWLTQEMDRRYKFFEEVGCSNIDQYNNMIRDKNKDPKMYRIVLIVDEMADLMMTCKDNTVEECIVRIAQLARACGIHMVIATQRPIVKVITGLIKGNILHRVAFTVKSNQDSRVILDDGGAEELLGYGDMLYSFPSNLVRMQGALIEIDEIKAVCDYIRANNEGDFDEELVKIVTHEPPKPETAEEKSQAREEERDADFERLLRKVLKSFILEQRASVSSAQASHHVGYIKARKLVDAMAERGFLSKGDGAKPRDILITLDQYYELFGKDGDMDINTTEDDVTDE